jgi:hypothetical protein
LIISFQPMPIDMPIRRWLRLRQAFSAIFTS